MQAVRQPVRFADSVLIVCVLLLGICVGHPGLGVSGEEGGREPNWAPILWSSLTPYDLPHDGYPFETEHFAVYSNTASERKKEFVGEQTERAFSEIMSILHLETTDSFTFLSHRPVIEILLIEAHWPEWGGFAYHGGFLLSPVACNPYYCSDRVIKHELMHVVGFLLSGPGSAIGMIVDVWFDEGLAEYVAGAREIHTMPAYTHRRSQLAEVMDDFNPVSVHTWENLNASATSAFGVYAYELFELAVRYLFDEDGLAVPVEAVTELYVDLHEGYSFADAFERQFGLSLGDYEAQFNERMLDFLP